MGRLLLIFIIKASILLLLCCYCLALFVCLAVEAGVGAS